MKLTIKINCDNAAFEDGFHSGDVWEVRVCLRHVADKLSEGQHEGKIQDSNGNTVGQFKYE